MSEFEVGFMGEGRVVAAGVGVRWWGELCGQIRGQYGQTGCLEGGRGSRIEDEAQGRGNRPTLLTGWLRWAQGRSRTP